MGQEQDSLGGGFSTVQHFDGTLKDVRIFDDVRTAGEISTNSLSDVSSSESGLIADWKMDDLSGGVTTDAVSGNNLTVGNVTGSGWTSSTPTLYTDIAENAAGGTVIGTLSATDPDTSDTLTYSISSDPSGKFEVVNNELRLKSGQTLDYETATSYDVDLQVSDGNGGTDTVTVTVDVRNVVEPPSDITFASSSTVTTSMQPGTVVSTASAVVEGSATYSLTDNACYTIDGNSGQITITSTTTPTYSQQTGASNPFDGFDVGIYADPSLADIDGDGDLDMFVGDYYGNIEYYENTGSATNPVFAAGTTNSFGLSDIGDESSPTFVDIDNDGDLDAFVGDFLGGVFYFENTGNASSPSFAAGTLNPFGFYDVGLDSRPEFVDIDNDGDFDAFVIEDDGTINYFENTGTASNPSFAAATSNPFGLADVGWDTAMNFADMENDGDRPVNALYRGDRFAGYAADAA